MKIVKGIITTAAVIAAVVAVLGWSSQQDVKRAAAMDRYDACMLREYRMTAANYYALNQSLPECE